MVRKPGARQLQVRSYREENLHSKVYIFSFVDGHIDKGRMVTGSSNLSQSGLVDQLEFNVELKNRSDYEFALAKFEQLWAEAVEVSDTYVHTIQRKSQYAEFTPYELYLKFLYEYFREELNRPGTLDDDYLPSGSQWRATCSSSRHAACASPAPASVVNLVALD